ncbi:MAG: DNA primase [Pseudorhodoplanes sp.]|uniref:DNA primase n=1 Tax=Pseudorhodoplanes sp. TaxID=1934341 RepID=UPI003D0E293A
MRFSADFLEELKARLPVSEVVGRRVKLMRAGREWKGLSPFNQEKTPSFFVNDQKQAWFDFSSHKNGSIFDFIMLTDGVSFPEAVERLATMAGMPMPKVSREEEVREQRRKSLYEVVDLASKFFEATLQSRTGAKARGYLADRGLGPETQLRFRMGYAPPDRFALKEHLGQQGVSVEDMIEAGLLVHGDDIPVPYDRFRDRVMFPIADWRGRLIAFGGRALSPDAPAKYLNSPETPLFHKGSILFNGANARMAAHDGKPLIVVEGYVDVIAMVTTGYEGAVAPLGTALTEEQLGLLWKIADEPMLCFDGDKAGRRAAYRAVDLALPKLQPGKSLAFALLPEGQDPDDLIRSGGRAAMEEVLKSARPLADILWMRETESSSFDTPERRAALEARIGEIVGTIASESVRKYYRQDFEARVRALFMPSQAAGGFERGRGFQPANRRGGARGDWRAAQRPARDPFTQSARLGQSPLVRGFRSAISPREALILLSVIEHPWLLEAHTEEFAEIELVHPDADQLRRAILDAASGEALLEPKFVQDALSARGLNPLVSRIRAAITHASDWPARAGAGEADVAQWWAHIVTLHRKARTLNRELKDAERALGDDPSEANLAWIRDVQNRLAALEGTEALIEGFGASSGRLTRGV